MKTITIIGGGSAALILASQLDPKKYRVSLYEKKKTLGRKFLVAGEGGLNLTFNSGIQDLISQYSPMDFMDPILRRFSNDDLIHWLKEIEVPTFIGSSNRVFPIKDLKPIEVLKKIIDHIALRGVNFNLNQEWTGWDENGYLTFKDSESVKSDFAVFALGGASWKVTGSDGSWIDKFTKKQINIIPFRAANCAFEIEWEKQFLATHEGSPLKNIALNFEGKYSKGELVISKFGLEGNALYALSQKIQEKLSIEETAVVYLDLKPSLSAEKIESKIKNSPRSKITDILKKDLKLQSSSIGLLKQFSDKETFLNPSLLSEIIKSLPLEIKSADEIDRAISTLGGIDLNEIDSNFQLKKIPNSYAIGEMLDWYAPTGGYLLQACFSMGFVLADYFNEK